MKWTFLLLLLFSTGCSYWPQTLEPEYYDEGIKEMKEDLDDVTSARTL